MSKHPPAQAPRPGPGALGRREQIIEEGLGLIAERGVAGASLRELARRVGISQPSLYHHFATKDALVAEIVRYGAARMVEKSAVGAFPERLDQLPRFIADICFDLYATEQHPKYIRFLFAVCIEEPSYRPLIQQVFTEIMEATGWMACSLAEHTPITQEEGTNLIKLLINAVGFPLLEERALWGLPEPTPALRAYVDGMVQMMEEMIRLRWGSERRGA